jgi:L-lactate dehydrogenase complex protein LldG
MTEREKILARIREALAVPALFPGAQHGVPAAPHTGAAETNNRSSSLARTWLPLVGESFVERLALFQQNSADLKSAFELVDGQEHLSRSLCTLRDGESWKKIATHSGELTEQAVRVLDRPVCRTDRAYDVGELESCDVGITECDALIAQTGSVLVTARSAGGRALSVLPPHHVVLARRDQLIPDLSDAFALLKKKYGANYPSFISFITGPSRTGDIERILVLGAHGPRKLTVFLL